MVNLRVSPVCVSRSANYVRKVAELAVQFFIANDRAQRHGPHARRPSADFKTELLLRHVRPACCRPILMLVDVSYGGDNGFNQAIELASEVLRNVKFIREKKLISQFFDKESAQDSGKCCFGVDDTLEGARDRCMESLLVYENLETTRLVLKHGSSGGEGEVRKEQMANQANFRGKPQTQVRDHRVSGSARVVHERIRSLVPSSRSSPTARRRLAVREGLWWHWRNSALQVEFARL